jgi:hypothetical protein
VAQALKFPAAQRTAKQTKALTDFRLKDNPEHARLEKEKARLEADLRKFKAPTTLVMRESEPRMSTLFQRGEFRTPGDKVEPHTPAVLHPLRPTTAAVPKLTPNSELRTQKSELVAHSSQLTAHNTTQSSLLTIPNMHLTTHISHLKPQKAYT